VVQGRERVEFDWERSEITMSMKKYLTKRQQMFAKAIKKELRFYEAHKAEFLKKYRNKHIAIRNGEVIGVGDDSAKLMDKVWAEYGHDVPILFKHVVAREPHYRVPHANLVKV
jgi:hypothetical protein